MTRKTHFDYIIIGNGLAGLQLALALANDSFFKDKKIALIDKSKKNTNNKTWCFWEKGIGKWDHLVAKTWKNANFHSSKKTLNLKLEPYQYKMLRSIDFYNEVISILSKKEHFTFIIDEIISTEEHITTIHSHLNYYTANHIFDSRIPEDFCSNNKSINIIQHFKGYIIETEKKVFNPETFTMMDYRIKDGNQTSFTYVLPLSENKALVEFTYFNKEKVKEEVYDSYLKKYISELLNIEDYNIIETEKGNIPMTTFPFKKYSTKNVTKIGTAGGWVKGSTGYSFKHTEKKVSKIIENLKHNQLPSLGLIKKKFQFYDKVFLKVLHDENEKGEWIFEQFYSKNSIETMFRFLDEESKLREELAIMGSLFSPAFLKAFFKTL